jgi:hypothetical protein
MSEPRNYLNQILTLKLDPGDRRTPDRVRIEDFEREEYQRVIWYFGRYA